MKRVEFTEKDMEKLFIVDTPKRRARRAAQRFFLYSLGLILVFSLFFVALNFSALYKRAQFLRGEVKAVVAPAPTQPQATAEQPAPLPQFQPRIQIPRLGLDAPIILNIEYQLILEELKRGVVHYADTALPGQRGNTVLVGHSSDYPWSDGQFKTIFALLDRLVAGDKILVYYGHQVLEYTVREIEVVAPNRLDVLQKTENAQLTLLTCYPVGTSINRLIVRADLTSGEITGVQASEPITAENLPRPR